MVPGVIWVLPVQLVKPRGPTPMLVDGFQPVSEHGQLVLVLLFSSFPWELSPLPGELCPCRCPWLPTTRR